MADEPFGALKPSPSQERARTLAHRLPDTQIARKLSSLLLGPAGGRSGAAFDVDIFGSQKARLHPSDNICEKRVYLTPQHWDPKERALLAGAIAAHADDTFYFVDVGANAGLYTLFARAAAETECKQFRALCVEPDPEMRARLGSNLAASGAQGEVAIAPFAATAADGAVLFAVNAKSRGMSRIDKSGSLSVEGRTLPRLFQEAGFARIDAMKIDVEGHELDALRPLFADPGAPKPRLLIVEVSHEARERPIRALLASARYAAVFEGRLNAVFVRE